MKSKLFLLTAVAVKPFDPSDYYGQKAAKLKARKQGTEDLITKLDARRSKARSDASEETGKKSHWPKTQPILGMQNQMEHSKLDYYDRLAAKTNGPWVEPPSDLLKSNSEPLVTWNIQKSPRKYMTVRPISELLPKIPEPLVTGKPTANFLTLRPMADLLKPNSEPFDARNIQEGSQVETVGPHNTTPVRENLPNSAKLPSEVWETAIQKLKERMAQQTGSNARSDASENTDTEETISLTDLKALENPNGRQNLSLRSSANFPKLPSEVWKTAIQESRKRAVGMEEQTGSNARSDASENTDTEETISLWDLYAGLGNE